MSSPELNTEKRDFNQQPSHFSFLKKVKTPNVEYIIVTLLARWILSFYTSGQDKAELRHRHGSAEERKDQFGQCLFASEILEAEQH